MITIESIMLIEKDMFEEASKSLDLSDIAQLVEWLALKDDNVRYRAFQLLQYRSMSCTDVYRYWDIFIGKMKSDNSYQRSIGLMLLAENVKWDNEYKTEGILGQYMQLLNDEKNITVRQCIQSLGKIVTYKPETGRQVADRLITLDLSSVKDTMRKLILLDILNVLLIIRRTIKAQEIENYILDALAGGILDKKSVKQIQLSL